MSLKTTVNLCKFTDLSPAIRKQTGTVHLPPRLSTVTAILGAHFPKLNFVYGMEVYGNLKPLVYLSAVMTQINDLGHDEIIVII